MANEKKKPLLWAQETSDSEQLHEADAYAWENFTPGWVPGYDEVVKANTIAGNPTLSRQMKEHYYKQLGTGPRALPGRLKWVRVAGVDGARSYNASVDLAEWRRQGYRPATLAVLEEAGMRLPPTAYVDVDGTIRREDTALWFVDEARAQANDRKRDQYNAEFHSIRARETGNSEVPFIEVEDAASYRQQTLQSVKEL